MGTIQTELKPGDRVTVEVTGTVAFHGDFSLNLKVPGVWTEVSIRNDAFRVARNRGPELVPGARAFSAGLEQEVEIVLRDDASDAYVVRLQDGGLYVHPDNSDLTPAVVDGPGQSEAA